MNSIVVSTPSVRRRLGASALVRNRAAVVGLLILIPLLAATLVPWLLTRSEEHTSELQSLSSISYAVFCLDRKSVV